MRVLFGIQKWGICDEKSGSMDCPCGSCGVADGLRQEKKEEDTRPNGSYGYKKYRYREEKEKEKILLEEYENLVTETVRNTYDELGVLISTYHAFFDETGEHLLKDISRTIGVTVVTKEYDSLGRCIVETICGDA